MNERSALVTGASSGIGLAVTRALRREGFAVTMVARDPAKLAAAVGLVAQGSGPPVQQLAGSVPRKPSSTTWSPSSIVARRS